jgi:hypothetical protein
MGEEQRRQPVPQCSPICSFSEALLRAGTDECVIIRLSAILPRSTPRLVEILDLLRDLIEDWTTYYLLPFGGYRNGQWVEFLRVPHAHVGWVFGIPRATKMPNRISVTKIRSVADLFRVD